MRGSWREHSGRGEDVYLHVHDGAASGFERLALRARTREPWLQLCGWLALATAAWLLALRLASPGSAADGSDALRSRLQEDPAPPAAASASHEPLRVARLEPHALAEAQAAFRAPAETWRAPSASRARRLAASGAASVPSAGTDAAMEPDGSAGSDGWVAPAGPGAPAGAPTTPPELPGALPGLDGADQGRSIVIDDEKAPVEPPAVLHVPVSEESLALEPESDAGESAEKPPTTAPPSPPPGLTGDPSGL